MRKNAIPKKEEHKDFLRIVGTRIETYSLSVMIVLSIVLLLLTGSMITWGVSPDVVSNGHEIAYYVTHGLVMAATIANIIILIINKKWQVPFHVIAIIHGEDLTNLDAVLKDFDEKMLYSTFTYEGVELIFSVARGFTRYNGEPNFRSTMQIADDAMYENKKYLKEKYNMKGR